MGDALVSRLAHPCLPHFTAHAGAKQSALGLGLWRRLVHIHKRLPQLALLAACVRPVCATYFVSSGSSRSCRSQRGLQYARHQRQQGPTAAASSAPFHFLSIVAPNRCPFRGAAAAKPSPITRRVKRCMQPQTCLAYSLTPSKAAHQTAPCLALMHISKSNLKACTMAAISSQKPLQLFLFDSGALRP